MRYFLNTGRVLLHERGRGLFLMSWRCGDPYSSKRNGLGCVEPFHVTKTFVTDIDIVKAIELKS